MSKSSNMVYPDKTPVGRYSAIGNEVLEKVADIELTREERKIMDRIMRDTIGYRERELFDGTQVVRVTHDIPTERFIEKTGLSEKEITFALDNLEERHIIERDGDSITFNHHLDEWL